MTVILTGVDLGVLSAVFAVYAVDEFEMSALNLCKTLEFQQRVGKQFDHSHYTVPLIPGHICSPKEEWQNPLQSYFTREHQIGRNAIIHFLRYGDNSASSPVNGNLINDVLLVSGIHVSFVLTVASWPKF